MEGATKDVKTMLGDPRKAILVLSIPIAVAFLVQYSNNLVDSLWVTGLGAEAMAALGLVNPVYSVIISVGNGMAVGVSAAMARNIGMGRKGRAEAIASQTIILIVLLALIMTPILILTAEPVLMIIGAADTIDASMAYAIPLYLSSFIIMMSSAMSGMLRGEGAVRKSMYIQVMAAAVNIVLDPILIYWAGMGVAGAAWATVIACAASILLGLLWYSRKTLFITLRRSDLRVDLGAIREIMVVGFPQTLELMLMSLFNIVYNLCIIFVSSSAVMAIYTVVWRIVYLVIIPAEAVGGAMVSACSAEFGMKRYDMIKKAFRFSTKFSLITTIVLSVLVILLADPLASLFTYAPDMQALHGEMVRFTRIMFLCVPLLAMVFVGSSLLQAVSRSGISMWSSLIRNIALSAAFIAVTFTVGTLSGLWWAISIVEMLGGILMWYLAEYALKSLGKMGPKVASKADRV
ncbi:MAG: MATE family efflux transporter [Candidatus Methanomethylophilaceae archaeon]